MLLLGICDFGLGFWEQMQVANAARAGAEYAVKNGYNSSNIQTTVTNATNLSGIQASPAPTQTCGCPDAASGITRRPARCRHVRGVPERQRRRNLCHGERPGFLQHDLCLAREFPAR